MATVSKQSTHCNPFLHLKLFLYGDDPLKHLSNLYDAIKECRRHLSNAQQTITYKKQTAHDPMLWGVIEAELDDLPIGNSELDKTEKDLNQIFEYMGNNGLIGGGK